MGILSGFSAICSLKQPLFIIYILLPHLLCPYGKEFSIFTPLPYGAGGGLLVTVGRLEWG